MIDKVNVHIHKKKNLGFLRFSDGSTSPHFTNVSDGAMCFLLGVLQGKAHPNELRSILVRLNSTRLPQGEPGSLPIIVFAEIGVLFPEEETGPGVNPSFN